MFDPVYRLRDHFAGVRDQRAKGIFTGSPRLLHEPDYPRHHLAVMLFEPCTVHKRPLSRTSPSPVSYFFCIPVTASRLFLPVNGCAVQTKNRRLIRVRRFI
jgi:hypothetical protein